MTLPVGVLEHIVRSRRPPQPALHSIKRRVIDAALERRRPASFADLGGVWAVDAGYTFYALEKHQISRAVLVDEEFTPAVERRSKQFPQLELLGANFGDRQTLEPLGHLDAVFLFDVLLHQVDPDWDQVLEMYSGVTEAFVIVNPQYVRSESTIRLLDLGRDRYEATVPPQPLYADLFDRRDEFLPERGRRYGDIHNVWQWGIVDADLSAKMKALGFELDYYENAGQWFSQPAFENHAFIYSRR